jgi:hypothetical protein
VKEGGLFHNKKIGKNCLQSNQRDQGLFGFGKTDSRNNEENVDEKKSFIHGGKA